MAATVLTAGASAAEAPSWAEALHLTAQATVARVENASRTSYAPTRRDATTWSAEVVGSVPRQLAPGFLLLTQADFHSSTVEHYQLANDISVGGSVTLQRKFGLGPLAPVLQGTLGLRYVSARLGANEGWDTEAGVQIAKRLWPNLRVAAAAGWREHDARSGTFDVSQRSVSMDSRWDIDDRWSLSGQASRIHGDIVANAAWFIWEQAIGGGLGPVVQKYYTARPWSVTNLYGPGWVSYNVAANVDLWSVALGYAWSARTSLELRRSGAYVVNHIGIAYPSSTWGLSVSHRF